MLSSQVHSQLFKKKPAHFWFSSPVFTWFLWVSPAPKPDSTMAQTFPPGSRTTAQQRLLVFTSSKHTDSYFSFCDTVKMDSCSLFYYGPYLQRLLIATGRIWELYPHRFPVTGTISTEKLSLALRTVWLEDSIFGRKRPHSSQSPVHRVFGCFPAQRLKLLESQMQLTPSSLLSFTSPPLH